MRLEKFTLCAILLLLWKPGVAGMAVPAGLVGTYTQKAVVCSPVVDPRQDKWRERCHRGTNSAVISSRSGAGQKSRDLEVKIDVAFRNGHTCFFRGSGYWNGQDRVLAEEAGTGCRLVIVWSARKLHTVTLTDEQCRANCGSSGSLDSLVFTR